MRIILLETVGQPYATLCVNLKCDPDLSEFLRNAFEEVKPGYHMSKEHWNTIILDGNLPEDDLHDMVKHSFDLTKPKHKVKKQLI